MLNPHGTKFKLLDAKQAKRTPLLSGIEGNQPMVVIAMRVVWRKIVDSHSTPKDVDAADAADRKW
jgi:hypothetical protein